MIKIIYLHLIYRITTFLRNTTFMKRLLIASALFFLVAVVHAQEAPADTSYWKAGGTFSFAFSQVTLTNWAPGGENSVSGNGQANLFLNYNKNRSSWENFLGAAYGLMKQGSGSVRKTTDRLEIYTKYGYKTKSKWFYTGMAKFNTQFADGYKYPNDSDVISKAMAPAYVSLSAGMDYKPSDKFNLYIAPVSGKITIVNDDSLSAQGAFGVEPGETSRSEFGGFMKVKYTDDIIKNVNLLTTVDLFSNYIKNPQYIDVSWEVILTMTINKWLTANINTHLVFDKDILFKEFDDSGVLISEEAKVQFKELVGIGLTFKL